MALLYQSGLFSLFGSRRFLVGWMKGGDKETNFGSEKLVVVSSQLEESSRGWDSVKQVYAGKMRAAIWFVILG